MRELYGPYAVASRMNPVNGINTCFRHPPCNRGATAATRYENLDAQSNEKAGGQGVSGDGGRALN